MIRNYDLRTTADQLISDYTRTKTMNKAEKLKNNREKAILEVSETEMDNLNNLRCINLFSRKVTAGVREYFNVMLSSQLLYRQERHQYEQLVKQVT